MSKKQIKNKSKKKKDLHQSILEIFKANASAVYNYKQIAGFLEITDKNLRKHIYELLVELAQEGRLKETARGKFKINTKGSYIEGKVDISKRGAGFVISEDLEEDLYIPVSRMQGIIHGDLVRAQVVKGRSNKKLEGKIIEVLDRAERVFVGTIDKQKKYAFLMPDDRKIDIDIFIPLSKLNGAETGDKAIAKITDWPKDAKNPFGEITRVLGSEEAIDVQMEAIMATYGIPDQFPGAVIAEADKISIELDSEEIKKRRDFREVLTFTIDPVDAKDFDDAISYKVLPNDNVEIGVHIADVSHYVQPGSALDKEAYARGNSVYMVDRVVPMLPEHLSNGVCSLRPNEEKFTFSAVFELTRQGEVKNEWFGKTVICSHRRFTYEEAQEIIETGKGEFSDEIIAVNDLAKILRKERIDQGGLEISSSELRFELDENKEPIRIVKKVTKAANKLVEEFMLLANKSVGKFVGDTKRKTAIPFIYRVHDTPDAEKVEQFRIFVQKFGHQFHFKDEQDIARKMNELFITFKDDPNFNIIQQMAIKSMSKAIYDTDNIGHYGLGFRYYAHFTSPIRRYADLSVHRVLFDVLNNAKLKMSKLTETAKHISITERRAVEAERASKKYYQAHYLKDQIGQVFTGVITGLTDWGIFVEMNENHCEGMVVLKNIDDDRYYFDEKTYAVIGAKSNRTYNMGDAVTVELLGVNLAKKQVDLTFVD
jgi:ribonuclease R